ncbi:hypothetical protein BDR05DRAFT_952394 [Suillus weaverae]|nr:hypothetical protein BDR05DRAFT_952394 [Suillus weaverae]
MIGKLHYCLRLGSGPDNVIPPQAVPLASSAHGPLLMTKTRLKQGTFCKESVHPASFLSALPATVLGNAGLSLTRPIVKAVENTQKPVPASNDLRNSALVTSTLTIAESPSSTPKLEGGEVYVSAVCKHQSVKGGEEHLEQDTESEVEFNFTPYSRTVRIFEGHTSEIEMPDTHERLSHDGDYTRMIFGCIETVYNAQSVEVMFISESLESITPMQEVVNYTIGQLDVITHVDVYRHLCAILAERCPRDGRGNPPSMSLG